MGIVNVTPDSFSDGGLYFKADAAIAHGKQLVADGADILDIGGESTRPGAEPVPLEEELRRVMPVVEGLAGEGVPISIDTYKAPVARAAVEAGATIINDVTALRGDPAMAGVCTDDRVTMVVLMHMKGEPRTMQQDPTYDDVVAEVKQFLADRVEFAADHGIAREKLWIDPGIGFGKTTAHNLELIRQLHELKELDRPIVIGTSRKRFLGDITVRAETRRIAGTVSSSQAALGRGAAVVRTHDVEPMRDGWGLIVAVKHLARHGAAKNP
jgi:dihydropteroate synthase